MLQGKPECPPVYVTGVGVISCAGSSADALWTNVYEQRSGITAGLGHVDHASLIELVAHSFPDDPQIHALTSDLPASKPLLMSCLALYQAVQQAGWSTSNAALFSDLHALTEEDGIIFATTTGQITAWDQQLQGFLNHQMKAQEFSHYFKYQPLGSLLQRLTEYLSFNGKSTLLTSACSASSQAIALGVQWLKQGRVKRCLIGGAEILCQLTCKGFESLQLLSASPTTPFDLNRKGISLSEGAAFLCLETEPKMAPPLALISGYGLTTDGYHMTAPHPQGQGCYQAMKTALAMAQLDAHQIDWVHAHGTGSPQNDHSEGGAIAQLFADVASQRLPWVSSTKAIHGHALGASGVLEAVLCLQALKHQTVLNTAGLKNPDPKINVRHPSAPLKTSVQHILKNTLGFGGNNAALVFSRVNHK